MTSTGAKVAFLACGAVAQDTAALIERHGWDADVHGISSDLHMTPLEIAPAVEAKLQVLLPRYERVIVVYGDCGTGGRLDAVLERYPGGAAGGRATASSGTRGSCTSGSRTTSASTSSPTGS